jgi:uncharacterized membrane protein
MTHEIQHELSEERQSLWLLVLSPSIWAVHLLASYAVAAIWCGGVADRESGVGAMRAWIAISGVLAIGAIGFIGRTGWRKYKLEGPDPPLDRDTAEDRHRFLGAATVLLSGLSAIATLYVCLSLFFVRNCL